MVESFPKRIDTRRPRLVKAREPDRDAYIALMRDPEMTRLTAAGPRDEEESRRRYDRILEDWKVEGYGSFLARLHETKDIIGLFTLTSTRRSELGRAGCDGVEIGWGIAPGSRGEKLGLEGARALVECVDRHLSVDVYTRCRTDNAASMRIVDALGMAAVTSLVDEAGSVVFRRAAHA